MVTCYQKSKQIVWYIANNVWDQYLNSELWTMNIWTMNYELWTSELWTMNYELWTSELHSLLDTDLKVFYMF